MKLESVYLRGMGMTGIKLRSIVSSIFERSRSAAGAMQGNVCHQGVSVARGHTVYNCIYNIEIAVWWFLLLSGNRAPKPNL